LATQEKEHAAYGDKSGPNLYFVDRLLSWFPDGRVLHVIRDPRAILTSQHKRLMLMLEHRHGSSKVFTQIKKLCYSPIIVLYILTYWGHAIRIDNRLRRSHPQSYKRVQFEELVAEPEKITRDICRFLSIPWDPQMMEPPKRDSSFIDPNDVQKKVERGTGMDRDAAERWRKHIRPWMRYALHVYGRLFYRGALERFGYVDA
jgi:omega-hydroxy-beta-dihydromenaquinone-9 sulfotransferase